MKKLMYLVMLIAMALFAADASAQYIPVTASSCIVDGSGSTITSGTLIVVGTDSNDNPVVYRAGTSFITTTAPVTKTITAGSVPGFQLADPSSSSPLNVSYRFVVQDNTTKKITVYKGINITPNDVLSGGVFTTFNICKMNPGAGVASFGGFTTPSLVSGDWTVTRDLIVNRNSVLSGNTSIGATLAVNGLVIDGATASTLTAALVLCPNPGTLIITTSLSVATNISVPSTCTLSYMRGGSLAIATGATVTFNSVPLAPDDAQIFFLSGTGAVAGLTFTRPEWFGGTTSTAVQSAYNSCVTNGCRIAFRLGTYISPWISLATEITKTNLELAGSGQPDYNSQTAPTALSGGTILQGPIWVKSDPSAPANGFSIHDIGQDGGSAVCTALFAGVAQQGVFLNNNFSSGSTDGPAFLENPKIINVTTLGQSTVSATHSILCDNCDGLIIQNVKTLFNIYGVVDKGQRYTINGIYSRGHSTAGLYVKSDSNFGIAQDNNISNVIIEKLVTAGDTAGAIIESQATQKAQATNISNFIARGTISGLSVVGTNTFTPDVNLNGFIIDSTTNTAIAIGGTFGTARVTIANGIINSPASGDGITLQNTNVSDTSISNVIITNVASGNGITNSGTRTKVSNVSCITTSGWCVQGIAGSLSPVNITGSSNAAGLVASTNLIAATSGSITIVNGSNLSFGRMTSAGSIPSCSVTGAGASATCTIGTGSTDSLGLIAIGAAGAGPASTGTLTITLTSAIGTHSTSCLVLPSNTGSAAWNARATFFQNNVSTTAPVMTWDNNAVAVVAGSSYQLSYTCFGL